MLVSILSRQNFALLRGHVTCSGQPCQKQPSTKTATRALLNTTSASRRTPCTGRRCTRYRSPAACSALRSATSIPVSRDFCLLILDRTSGVVSNELTASIVQQPPHRPPVMSEYSVSSHQDRVGGTASWQFREVQRSSSQPEHGSSAPQHEDGRPGEAPKGRRAGSARGRGGAGNRTRVLCRFNKTSPCAVHCVSTWPHRSREQAGVTGPAAVSVPSRVRGQPATVSPLADAGKPGRRRPRADRRLLAQAASATSRWLLTLALIGLQRRLRWSPACTGTLPLNQRPESKPFTPL